MKLLRPIVSVVLGLVLLVQGVAVASAPIVAVAADAPAPPCHGDVPDTAAEARSCCNDDCPDMASCAFGHIGLAASVFLPLLPAQGDTTPAASWSSKTVTLQSHLRPPIVSHA